MIDSNAEESISTLSDSSFVILGQGSLPSQLNDDYNGEQNSNSLSKSAFSVFESNNSTIDDKLQNKWMNESSLSEEETQKKLVELTKENYQLKETLSQNNLAIKSQLDTFFMWQQEVLKTHETHKQKFLETKNLILKLRGENSNLKKQLEESLSGVSFGKEEFIHSQVIEKPEELSLLNEKVKNYEVVCNELTIKNENLKMENQKLKENLEVARSEMIILGKLIDDLRKENSYLKQKNNDVNKNSLESLTLKSLPNLDAQTQISNFFKQLEEEKGKVLKLKEELKKTKSSSGEVSNSKLSATEELNQCVENINDMNTSLNMQNQRFNSLQSWVSLAEENFKENKVSEGVECDLLSEIKELKSHLDQEENVSREKQESLEELKMELNRLLGDYKTLQLQLSSIKNNELTAEKYNETLSVLSTQLEAKDKELIAKQEECDNLKETVKKLNAECEEIAILRVQVELYQNDFNDEQAARKKLVKEKEEMAEQVQLLQSQLKALEKLNSKENNSISSPLESPGKKRKYMCPKCSFSFSDLDVCEKHIDECLNIDFYP